MATFPSLLPTRAALSRLSIVAVLILCSTASFAAPINFNASRAYVGGSSSLALNDFNGDGLIDVAAEHSTLEWDIVIEVLLGQRNGTFLPGPLATPRAHLFEHVRSADLNRDGKADLIVHTVTEGNFEVFLGNGNATFQSSLVIPAGVKQNGPLKYVLTDLNLDSIPDIVAGSTTGVAVMIGNGDGTFQQASSIPLGACADVAPAHANGDDKADIIAVCGSSIVTLVGNGSGGLETPISAPLESPATVLAVADVNRDGRLDAVVASSSQPGISLLPGTGLGTWGLPVQLETIDSVEGLTVDDLNLDGKPDLLATIDWPVARGLWVFLGAGGNSFLDPAMYATPSGPVEIAVATLRPARIRDVIVSSGVCVLWNWGNGQLRHPAETFVHPIDDSELPDQFDRLDINRDGLDDVLAAGGSEAAILFATGDPRQPFRVGQTMAFSAHASVALFADFNKDGVADAAIGGHGDLRIYLGTPSGTFLEYSTITTGFTRAPFAAGDFDGDGNLDLAGPGIDVFYGSGDGAFSPALQVNEVNAVGLVATDFDHDGLSDIAYAPLDYPGDLRVRFGRADRTFSEATSYPTPSWGEDVLIGDLNQDSIPDLVYVEAAAYQVFLGDGSGQLRVLPAVKQAYLDWVKGELADFNGDGLLDLAVLDSNSNILHVFAGSGTGHFGTATTFLGGASPYSLVGGHFTDGQPGRNDLAISNWDGTLVLLRNHAQVVADNEE